MKLSAIFFSLVMAAAIFFSPKAEANLPVIGIVDFASRVTITNLNDEQVLNFQSASSLIINELQFCAELHELTTDATKAIADELYLMMQVGKVTPQIQELASAEGCEYLLIGFLTNLSRATDEKIIGKGDGIRAGLSVKIFDMSTGKEIATFTGRGIAMGRANRIGKIFRSGQFEFSEDSLNQALEKAAHEIAEKIKKNI